MDLTQPLRSEHAVCEPKESNNKTSEIGNVTQRGYSFLNNVACKSFGSSTAPKVGATAEFSILPRHGENSKLRTGSQAFPAFSMLVFRKELEAPLSACMPGSSPRSARGLSAWTGTSPCAWFAIRTCRCRLAQPIRSRFPPVRRPVPWPSVPTSAAASSRAASSPPFSLPRPSRPSFRPRRP